MRALVIGGAAGVWEEAQAALQLFSPDIAIGVNAGGRDWPRRLDHWVSFHCEHFPAWVEQRATAGRPAAKRYWTGPTRERPRGMAIDRVPNWRGSSGLMAVTVALQLGCSHVVLAGVPLDPDVGHHDDPTPWRDGGNYRRAWADHQADMAQRVRSMSGWTRKLLGEPTAAWLTSATTTIC